jgi:hypothetical protein
MLRNLRLALLTAPAAFALVALASPADARTCVRAQCSWTVVMGKCKTFAGVRVPCPLRKKVCAEHYCY